MKPLVIIGAGDHARVVLVLAARLVRRVVGLLDGRTAPGGMVGGLPVLGNDDQLDDPRFVAEHSFALGIGSQAARRAAYERLKGRGADLPSLVDPSALIGAGARIGPGAVVLPGAIVCNDATVGAAAILNTGAQVDHDGRIATGVHLSPGAICAGGVQIGAWSFVGPGAVVTRHRSIGAGALVGAGSIVVADVPAGVKAFGNPCRVRGPAAADSF